MSGMYPQNQVLEIFGEQMQWPGVGPDGKFNNGSFTDPLIKPSFIPAATLNLIIDNIQSVIEAAGLDPNNIEPDQLARALQSGRAAGLNLPGRFLAAGDKRKLAVKAGTVLPLTVAGETKFFVAAGDTELDLETILDTGSLQAGKTTICLWYPIPVTPAASPLPPR